MKWFDIILILFLIALVVYESIILVNTYKLNDRVSTPDDIKNRHTNIEQASEEFNQRLLNNIDEIITEQDPSYVYDNYKQRFENMGKVSLCYTNNQNVEKNEVIKIILLTENDDNKFTNSNSPYYYTYKSQNTAFLTAFKSMLNWSLGFNCDIIEFRNNEDGQFYKFDEIIDNVSTFDKKFINCKLTFDERKILYERIHHHFCDLNNKN